MSEFTKGEWEYSVLADTQIPATLYANQYGNEIDIAVFEKWEQDWAKKEMEANAELIASAPQLRQQRDALLEACKSMQRYYKVAKEGRINPEENGDYWEFVMDDVDVAIAKCQT